MYRLYEIVLNYGKAYKAVMNEMFGDGIMSAIAFSTKVEKKVEVDPGTVEYLGGDNIKRKMVSKILARIPTLL